jgi:hypothetical protein
MHNQLKTPQSPDTASKDQYPAVPEIILAQLENFLHAQRLADLLNILLIRLDTWCPALKHWAREGQPRIAP